MEYQDMLHGELLSIIIGIEDKGTIYFNEIKLLFVQTPKKCFQNFTIELLPRPEKFDKHRMKM